MTQKKQRPWTAKETTEHLTAIIGHHNNLHDSHNELTKRVGILTKRVNVYFV